MPATKIVCIGLAVATALGIALLGWACCVLAARADRGQGRR